MDATGESVLNIDPNIGIFIFAFVETLLGKYSKKKKNSNKFHLFPRIQI